MDACQGEAEAELPVFVGSDLVSGRCARPRPRIKWQQIQQALALRVDKGV